MDPARLQARQVALSKGAGVGVVSAFARLNYAVAIRKNRKHMKAMSPARLLAVLKSVIPALLYGVEPARRVQLMQVMRGLGTTTKVDRVLVQWIALWQMASQKRTVDGWLGASSHRSLEKQRRRRRAASAFETTQKARAASAKIEDNKLAQSLDALIVKSAPVKKLVARLKACEAKMARLEGSTGGVPTSELKVRFHDISRTHQKHRRYKELSEPERAEFRTFIQRARATLATLSPERSGLTAKQLESVRSLLYRRLRALSPYYSQMAAGRAIDRIFNSKSKKKRFWAITCHFHSTAMAFEGMGRSARDFNGDWGKLLAVAQSVDASRYPHKASLLGLRLPEFLMLTWLYHRSGGQPSRARKLYWRQIWGYSFVQLSAYFDVQAGRTRRFNVNAQARSGLSMPSARTLQRELKPLLDQGRQVVVRRGRGSHYVRLEHLDAKGVVFDDPEVHGKNWRLTWKEAFAKGYFRSYTTFREKTPYEALVGSFSVNRAVVKNRRHIRRFRCTPATLSGRLREQIRARLQKHPRKNAYLKLLESLGTPTRVDIKLARLIGLWQKLNSRGRPDGWFGARSFRKVGFSSKRRR